jgi:hypothetical protein
MRDKEWARPEQIEALADELVRMVDRRVGELERELLAELAELRGRVAKLEREQSDPS